MTPSSSTLYFLVSLTLLIRTYPSHAQLCDYITRNFTPNSPYRNNRDTILRSLSSKVAASDGFYKTSAGESPNTVYVMAFCRGDTSAAICASCVNSAVQDLVVKCPNQKAAFHWGATDPLCFVRYSDASIYGMLQTAPTLWTGKFQNVTMSRAIWLDLSDGVVYKAVSGSSKHTFATGQAALPDNRTIYSLLQCTPDLSPADCKMCLHEASDVYDGCCGGRAGGGVYTPSCTFRLGFSLPAAGGDIDKGTGKSNKATVTTIAIMVPVGVATVLLFLISCFLRRKGKKTNGAVKGERAANELTTAESLKFDLTTIQAATNYFSPENKLGEGGFGEVFQGRLPNGQQIAVKRLSHCSRQGDEEFKNEVLLVAKLHHKNLVRLVGFCLEGNEKLLAYEFAPNKSLDYFLFDPEKRRHLDWSLRYNIICGIARGLLYLHEDSRLRIIHRDLKCSNILLDSGMQPKISDFGMARLFGVDQTQANTNKIVGTFGYMSPEYAMHGKFSVKSDVYSFGILLLEILCGKRNNFYYQLNGGEYLAQHAWNQWRDGMPLEVLDPAIVDSHSRDEILRCLHICLLCIQGDPAKRPTMATVVLNLSSNYSNPPVPQHPAFFVQSRSRGISISMKELEADESASRTMPSSTNGMSITELYPR